MPNPKTTLTIVTDGQNYNLKIDLDGEMLVQEGGVFSKNNDGLISNALLIEANARAKSVSESFTEGE